VSGVRHMHQRELLWTALHQMSSEIRGPEQQRTALPFAAGPKQKAISYMAARLGWISTSAGFDTSPECHHANTTYRHNLMCSWYLVLGACRCAAHHPKDLTQSAKKCAQCTDCAQTSYYRPVDIFREQSTGAGARCGHAATRLL
jgi:hypothetical protein